MKKLLALFLSLAVLLSFASCGDTEAQNEIVYLVIEEHGIVTIELYPDEAPITVENFTSLVNRDFYDGLTFHRIIETFMIQGGDPLGSGIGGADKDIKGEFAKNNVENNIKHVEGTISMARSGHPYEAYHNAGYINIPFEQREPYYNSASSQFFIVTETSDYNSRSFDGNYAAFGKVTDGMDIIKRIAGVATDENDRPFKEVVITTITFDRAEAEAAFAK